jgi:hypothetical protein
VLSKEEKQKAGKRCWRSKFGASKALNVAVDLVFSKKGF